MNNEIILKGLRTNNLKNISLSIKKNKITVFTGVSGSGKSSIVFDTIAAESKRQTNETFPSYVRSRLPKYPKPDCDRIEHLSPCVVIDQSPLGSTARSTVGTSSQIYGMMRLLFSRIGQPYAGGAYFFSFNDPTGMCPKCGGMGRIMDIKLDAIMNREMSIAQGALLQSMLKEGSWYYKKFVESGFFDLNKKLKDYSEREMNLLLYGAEHKGGEQLDKHVPGLYNMYKKRYLMRDVSNIAIQKGDRFIEECECDLCHGKRLNRVALTCWINGNNIADLCEMPLTQLKEEMLKIKDTRVQELVNNIVVSLDRLIDIGLGYLSLSRETDSLSGGEAQRVKLVRYLGSSLSDMLYIFDEPSSGMHPRDVYRMNNLLRQLRDNGNTVLVVEHDEDVIAIADEIIDVGPLSGAQGGTIVFQGAYEQLLQSESITGKALLNKKKIPSVFRKPNEFLPVRNASLHNLKNVSIDIPLGCICTVCGVAGSGKSSLMQVFASQYASQVIRIDQKPITANNRSTPASYLGFMDEIRNEFAKVNGCEEGWLSFNSLGACPHCGGKGTIVTELAYMDPIVTICEQCRGDRYNEQALSYRYNGKNILEVLNLRADEAIDFFDNEKIVRKLKAMVEVGLGYMTLGQPMSTLSGGERQRIKLAESLNKKGRIYLLDEPTTGLHLKDIDHLMDLFGRLVKKGNSVILIEHSLEVMKISDWLIEVGPDGGDNGGAVVFSGTPTQMLQSDTITAQCLKLSLNGLKCTEEQLQNMKTEIKKENQEEDMTALKLQPIGRIESEYGIFKAIVKDELKEGLKGLEGFSHVQVLWWFDGCDNEQGRAQLINNKPYTNGPDVLGTFATRSPARPNPIALSVCQIKNIDIEKGEVGFYYIDALHGTPLLDIKPYTPSCDKVETPLVPQWCEHWPKNYETSGDFDWEKEFNF